MTEFGSRAVDVDYLTGGLLYVAQRSEPALHQTASNLPIKDNGANGWFQLRSALRGHPLVRRSSQPCPARALRRDRLMRRWPFFAIAPAESQAISPGPS